MAILQARGVPDDVYGILAERARAEGLSLSAYVVRILSAQASRPTVREWAAAQRQREPLAIDSVAAVEAGRDANGVGR